MFLRIGWVWPCAGIVLGAFACSSDGGGGAAGASGTGGAGGTGGTAGAGPELYRTQKVDKVDLLFMIDNSASMGDKQKILSAAVPDLVARLTNPVCVDRGTREQVGSVAPDESCSEAYPNSEREFEPIVDIHIGVITSSLGGHGADTCSDADLSWNPHQADMAHLITRGRDDAGNEVTVDTYQGQGFLNWDPTGKKSTPPGEQDVDRLITNFTQLVRGADQDGCGFEGSLEAWYRFLVDPVPYEQMVPVPCSDEDTNAACRGPKGVDQIVLKQRADFLRDDSLVGIIMLTDENDCSLIDSGRNYTALQSWDGMNDFHLSHGTDACHDDPWSEDCKSCADVSPAQYPECKSGWSDPMREDPLNLRCMEQKRRFGTDYLYPVRRYVDALTKARLSDGDDSTDNMLNPLFCSDQEQVDGTWQCRHLLRDSSLIFLAGIVGVPWQDIANDSNNLKNGYRPVEQLSWTREKFAAQGITPPNGLPDGANLWNVILGQTWGDRPGDIEDVNGDGVESDSELNVRKYATVPTVDPLDPLMRESVAPRTGTHPATGVDLVQPGTSKPGHPVNGSERDISNGNDLQYACVFELGDLGPIDCLTTPYSCDCPQSQENPLCWDGNAYGTKQYRAKAYPGRRQLAVLKGVGSQAIVASVCPANMTEWESPDFGYRPAIRSIVDRLKGAFQGTCWAEEIPIGADGTIDCVVLEATRSAEGSCPPCEGARSDATQAQLDRLQQDADFVNNGLSCVCQVNQTTGEALDTCVSDEVVTGAEGWCYIDPAQNAEHNANIVVSCPRGEKRLVRFVGKNIPARGALTYLQCSTD